jgi:catechol 2,3-dioxygenase-like lactoylglutathione lyase family enzyme
MRGVVVQQVSACISVADLDETAAWYSRVLGFETVAAKDFPEYAARVAYLEANGTRIELVEDQSFVPSTRPDPPRHCGKQGISQVALYVDDLPGVVDWLTSHGVAMAKPPATVDDLGLASFFIRDNEGNLVEFIQLIGGNS